MATEGVDGSGSSQNLTTVRNAAGNEIFFAGVDRDTILIDPQGVTAFDNQHVFIEFMGVRSGDGVIGAAPEGHLDVIGAIKDVTLDAGCRLSRRSNAVCGILHEGWEIMHHTVILASV